MTYSPISLGGKDTSASKTSMMATKGINNRIFSRFLDEKFAQSIKNYVMVEEGKLEKRAGLLDTATLSGSDAMEMAEKYVDNLFVAGYGTTVSLVDIVAGTETTLKTDFTASGTFRGVKYGDYFFVTNGVDTPQRIQRELSADFVYQAASTNYIQYQVLGGPDMTSPQTITGVTSGATATITAHTGTTTGVITITPINGTSFDPGESATTSGGTTVRIDQINPISEGSTITGATSNATANVLEVTNAGANSQTIVLANVQGTFQSGENITDGEDQTGRALLTSALTASINSTSVPACGNLTIWGNRLVAVALKEDKSVSQYSDVDDGTNPPFNTWNTGSGVSQGGKIYFRNGGVCKFAAVLGDWLIVFQEKGKFAVTLGTLDSGGTISKFEQTAMTRIDFGGEAGVVTPEGLFYVNEAGLWNLVSVGQNDVPFSDQEALTSELLGFKYFDDINFSNADLVHDARRNYLYITCAKNSDTNNHIIAYNLRTKSFQEFTNWNINVLLNDDQTIYAGSALETKLFKHTGSEDDGQPIPTEFIQEINMGDLNTRNKLDGFAIEGALSNSSSIQVDFDIYDGDGCYEQSKATFTWTAECLAVGGDGFDADPFAGHYDGDTTDTEGLVNAFDGCRPKIANFTRLLVRLTSDDRVPHIIYWFRCDGRIKAIARRRGISRN